MTRNIDYGMPRMRANEIMESAYINALMTEGHNAFNEAWVLQAGLSSITNFELTITLDHELYEISSDYGTTQNPDSSMPNFFSRLDDLQDVVFDSLFSRFRAQNIYGELTVIFRSSDNYSSRETSRDTF